MDQNPRTIVMASSSCVVTPLLGILDRGCSDHGCLVFMIPRGVSVGVATRSFSTLRAARLPALNCWKAVNDP